VIERPLSEVAAAVGGVLRGGDGPVSSVVTDSRLAEPGALFVALHGEHEDGHRFVPEAFEHGATAALVDRPTEGTVVEVADTGRALLDLASDERDRTPHTRVLAITGANGKTSTKDLSAAVIGTASRTHASPASFNNEVGLPMTLLGAPPATEVVIAEMGARRAGDVTLLCEVARPDAVVVTNVGVAHLGIFGSWEEIVRASREPVEWLGPGGVAILNADDPVARGFAEGARADVVTFGIEAPADVRAEELELGADARAAFTLVAGSEREPVELQVPGEHMVPNALAAVAGGRWLGMSLAECAAALKGARIAPWRMETFRTETGVLVVNDAYNANPESMAAGLKTARWMARDGRLVAVLGHMAELGPISFEEHEKVGELAVRIGVDRLITVGDEARSIARAAVREGLVPESVASYDGTSEAADDVLAWVRAGDVVLVKGSRVAGLESVADALGTPGGAP
jgi:UDP-N-acetylmuramoyl-tripeptide--D-alanyl-D-alanine ligase